MSFSLLIRPQKLHLHHSFHIPHLIIDEHHFLSALHIYIDNIHPSKTTMAIRLPRMVSSKKVPKGYFAVYVGENQKRFVIPVSFLNHPSFQDLLGKSEEEFGYSHPTGGLTIPCNEDTFLEVTSRMY
ncbi:hypothetical protein ES332_A03G236800v1 [Gossypium tomentosum]|nr:hypothetical protein ES332_A03G236800v1 [Gossypium tomentosum]